MATMLVDQGEKMQSFSIYEEKVFAKGMTAIMAPFAAIFLFLMMYQFLVGPIGDKPAPSWFFLIMFILFLGLTINFSRLGIRITDQSITVGYVIIKRKIPLENVEDCILDEASAVRYGGFGIRMTRVKGKNRLGYITIGTPRCVLTLKKGKFKEFAFSTKNPEEVMNVIKGQLSLQRKLR